jgi:hypothetical protein
MGTAQCRSSPCSKIVLSREFRCTGRLGSAVGASSRSVERMRMPSSMP